MYLTQKLGQTTIFILVSIIIVIIAAFVMFTSDIEIFYSPQDRAEGQIRENIEFCLDQSLSRGVFYLQYQGGVINTSNYIRFRDDYLQLGKSVNSSKLPNWDVEDGRYPTTFSMENELNDFVKVDVIPCISSSVRNLDDVFDITITYDLLEVSTQINYETIDLEAILPLEFKEINGDVQSTMDEFTIRKESKLGDLYELAIEIYNLEQETYLFEELTLDQIFSASNYGDRTTSMPSQGIEFSCTPRIWLKSDLKETLAQLNNNNFRYLEFIGTAPIDYRFESNLGDNFENGAYFENFYSYTLENTKPSFENYEVNIFNPAVESFVGGYSRFGPYREFEVSPSRGEVIKSMEQGIDTGLGRFNFGCIQIYAHSYTIDYDLMIRLEDVSGETQDFFQFPLRVNIEQNEPKESNPTFIIPESQKPTLTEASYCVEETYEYPVRITVEDLNTPFGNMESLYLSNANISFKCLGMTCDLGKTQHEVTSVTQTLSYESPNPTYSGKVPYCYGGRFIAEKEGYFQLPLVETFPGEKELQAIDSQSPFDTTLYMVPTKSFELTRDSFEGRQWRDSCFVISDESNVDVYLQVEHEGYQFQSSALYSKGEQLPSELTSLELLVKEDVSYNVTAYYMRGDELLGLLEVENWTPDVEFSSSLELIIPIAANLDDDSFLEYYNQSRELYGELAHCTGLKSTPFGISLR